MFLSSQVLATMAGADTGRAAEIAVGHCPGKMDLARLYATSEEEIQLSFRPDPLTKMQTNWINPGLSAVYVVTNTANSLLKIGCADHLRRRMNGLNTGSPVPLKLVHMIYVLDGKISRRVEGEAHDFHVKHRERGEWFNVPVEAAIEAVAESILRNRFVYWTEEERRQLGHYTARLRNSWIRSMMGDFMKPA